MIEIVYSIDEWQAYINNMMYASAKTLKALMAYLNAHVEDVEKQVVIRFDIDDVEECDY